MVTTSTHFICEINSHSFHIFCWLWDTYMLFSCSFSSKDSLITEWNVKWRPDYFRSYITRFIVFECVVLLLLYFHSENNKLVFLFVHFYAKKFVTWQFSLKWFKYDSVGYITCLIVRKLLVQRCWVNTYPLIKNCHLYNWILYLQRTVTCLLSKV